MLALLTALVLNPAFAQDAGAEDVDPDAARAAPSASGDESEAAPVDAGEAEVEVQAEDEAEPDSENELEDEGEAENELENENENELDSENEPEPEPEADAPTSVVIDGARAAPGDEDDPEEPSDAFVVEGPPNLSPSPHGVGVGVILGAPTGLSGAWRPEGRSTAVAGLAWNFTERKLHVHADYLFTVYDMRVPEAPTVGFPIYVGGGARIRAGGTDGFDLGLRIPIGVNIMPDELPIDGFIELVPVVGLFPDTELGFEGGLGARVFFN